MENFHEVLSALEERNNKLNDAFTNSLAMYDEDDSDYGINVVKSLNKKDYIFDNLHLLDDEEIKQELFNNEEQDDDEEDSSKYYVNPLIYDDYDK